MPSAPLSALATLALLLAPPTPQSAPTNAPSEAVAPPMLTENARHHGEAMSEKTPEYRATVVARRPPPLGTRTKIDARELTLRAATNLSEALELETSIDIQEGPKSGSELQIRGFDERAVLVLFEGIPIREAYDGHFNIASLPAFALGGIDIERGEQPQVLIPKGTIFGAVMDGTGYSLAGCMVSPGFEFDDFELLEREELIKAYPQHELIIKRLTK